MGPFGTPPLATEPAFLPGGGELGRRIRCFDWTRTPLGAPAAWPRSLQMALRIMLASRQPMWIGWGPSLTYFYNDAYKSIVGGKHPRALGRPLAEVWREVWGEIEPMLDVATGGGRGAYVEAQLLIVERNGYPEETYYTFSFSPIPDDDGTVGGILCVNTDDTQRVVGERQLALLRNLAAGTADARTWEAACARSAEALATSRRDLPFALIYMAEPDGATMRLAGAAGIDRGHPAAPETIPVGQPSPGQASPWPVGAVLRTQAPRLVEAAALPAALPPGPWPQPPAQVAVLPILPAGETGRAGVLVAGLNRFRLYDDGYRSFLGLVAGQIAAAIGNAQAYEAERRRAEALAEIDRAKTIFFSNISHEFRTPLTLMLGPLEDALADRALPPEQRAPLATAHRNGLRLLKLVNTLLDMSQLEAGRLEASFEPIDLSVLTAELASNFEAAAARAGLALRIDCPPLPSPVHVDRDMWEKVVLNLLSNAIKFTFEGEIAVTVGLSADRRAAELAVRDTGVGVPEAELPRLFERFHRVEGQRGRSFEGSGIGLALVRDLVQLHGGTIGVDSRVGVGTTFTVRVPLGTGHLPPDRQGAGRSRPSTAVRAGMVVEEALRWLPDAEADAPAAAAGRTDGPRVLVVDDNADMRAYVHRLLGAHWQVEAVADAEAALQAIGRHRPDLVLSDVMLPGLDGFGLLRLMREDPALRGIPLILLSARAGEDARVEGLDAGADDYLVKPFSARELVARVRVNLELARARREAVRALETANERLEQRVADAAAERAKAEVQLHQAQKLEAIGRLTGGVAHDFNNVLQVVGGNLQLLARDVAGNPRAERRLHSAQSAISRGATLASQLLAFARRQPLSPRVVNLGRLIAGIEVMLRQAVGDGIEVRTRVADGLWNSFVDPAQVETALLNLAINARDAMDGQGSLTVELANAVLDEAESDRHGEAEPGQYVLVAVRDTGCGIAPDVLDRVFEPFFTTKPEGQGTGLGLSMVYGFVRQSGGHIRIDSAPGQGAAIRIYLPRTLAPEEVRAEADGGPVAGGTETVLVVEDDSAVRGTVADLLSELGYRVLDAPDAEQALAIIDSGAVIDLLFTDVVMPGPLRSADLASAARERVPGIAILFTSGYTENAIVHGGRMGDGVELLSKPYSREALALKLRQVLRKRG